MVQHSCLPIVLFAAFGALNMPAQANEVYMLNKCRIYAGAHLNVSSVNTPEGCPADVSQADRYKYLDRE